jgi:hypothetical protein
VSTALHSKLDEWGVSLAGLVSFVAAVLGGYVFLDSRFDSIDRELGIQRAKQDLSVATIKADVNVITARLDAVVDTRWSAAHMIEWGYEQERLNQQQGVGMKIYPPQHVLKSRRSDTQ